MKCLVCGMEYDDMKVDSCPRCSTRSFMETGRGEAFEVKKQELVFNRRKNLLGDFKVYIKAYVYEKTENGLEQKGEQRILVAEAEQIIEQPETIIWSDTAFGVSEELVLKVELDRNGTVEEHSFKMDLPKQTDVWKVGVRMDGTLHLRMIVGGEDSYSESDEMDLLLMK